MQAQAKAPALGATELPETCAYSNLLADHEAREKPNAEAADGFEVGRAATRAQHLCFKARRLVVGTADLQQIIVHNLLIHTNPEVVKPDPMISLFVTPFVHFDR